MLFDHIAIAAPDLATGTGWVEEQLGLSLQPGGQHAHFGTHNALMSLGPAEYLEVITIDPDAPPPAYPRWFDLDRFQGKPRVTNWILRSDDIDQALGQVDPGAGQPVDLARGAYRWRMAVPATGILPFDNMHPALITWDGPHPAAALPDIGARLLQLDVSHPDADALRESLPFQDDRVSFVAGPAGLRARIQTPHGTRELG
ncbi:VOC family protein [Actibacterium sp. 188UL27-1]|uniref:VOC family protein n=1 Tax=Actibacterium sp. 188UL27-1 TaxID=2786961 RepID=UPI0019589446|nr:VOC family protein [Actibacterium sp. 188UL27-1]MBM7069558.1 VOC family protein [Actibacterium sp. 188UL27-1]